ncbi:MAG: DinB family protein [Bacteroidota bacterium]
MGPVIKHIITQLKAIQDGKVWMGPTYARHLGKINASNAFIRPLPEMHSVAEILSHLTTWQKETILKIETGAGSLTDQAEENWYTNEKLKVKGWDAMLKEYQESMAKIIALLETKEDHFLEDLYYDTDFKGDYPYAFVINGMLQHSIYHLGQLGMIVKYLDRSGMLQ